MNGARHHGLRTAALVAAAALLLAPACTRNQRAERDGKRAGEAVCDVHDADDEGEAAEARAEALDEVEDLAAKHVSFTAEDRADVTENLEDLVEHVVQGNEALARQDLTVIARSLDNISDDVGDTSSAAASGFTQAIDDCT